MTSSRAFTRASTTKELFTVDEVCDFLLTDDCLNAFLLSSSDAESRSYNHTSVEEDKERGHNEGCNWVILHSPKKIKVVNEKEVRDGIKNLVW